MYCCLPLSPPPSVSCVWPALSAPCLLWRWQGEVLIISVGLDTPIYTMITSSSMLGFCIHLLKFMSPIMSLVCPFAFISAIIKSHIGEVDFGALIFRYIIFLGEKYVLGFTQPAYRWACEIVSTYRLETYCGQSQPVRRACFGNVPQILKSSSQECEWAALKF